MSRQRVPLGVPSSTPLTLTARGPPGLGWKSSQCHLWCPSPRCHPCLSPWCHPCPRGSPVGVLKAVSSCSSLRCVTWGSLGSSSPVSESGEGEQGVRGHGDGRAGWHCSSQSHKLRRQTSSAQAAPGSRRLRRWERHDCDTGDTGGTSCQRGKAEPRLESPAGPRAGAAVNGQLWGGGRRGGGAGVAMRGKAAEIGVVETRRQHRGTEGASRQGGGPGPVLGAGLAGGGRLPTVALFPAGAENFASIGAARERETSTPGYRPGLRRRVGRWGGPCPQHVPALPRGTDLPGQQPGGRTARGAWHRVLASGARAGAGAGGLPDPGPTLGTPCSALRYGRGQAPTGHGDRSGTPSLPHHACCMPTATTRLS